MCRPSAVSVTSPPSSLISLVSAASRSVSCSRRCATPRSVEGESARAATAAMPGVSSPTSLRSTSMPWIAPEPVNSRPASVSSQEPPISVKISRSASPGWVVRARPVGDGDPAAGDQGRGQERLGVRQVRLDGQVAAEQGARGDPPDVRLAAGLRGVDLGADRAQHVDGHPDVRHRGQGAADVPHLHALVEARAGEQQRARRTGRTRTRRSPPGRRPGRRRRARSAAARRGRRRRSGRRARAARRSRRSAGARTNAGRRRSGSGRRRARRPGAGSASPCRRCRRRPWPGRAGPRG